MFYGYIVFHISTYSMMISGGRKIYITAGGSFDRVAEVIFIRQFNFVELMFFFLTR